MKKVLVFLILSIAMGLGIVSITSAADLKSDGSQMTPGMAVTLTGEITKIEGEMLVLQDKTGREINVLVDKYTSIIGHVRQGAWIEAKVSPVTGHAELIKVLGVS